MNQIIKTMCEIIGDHQEEGGYLFPYSEKPIPVLLNKDKTTVYPEIRLSPFIQNSDAFTERYSEKTLRNYREWKAAKFQIDIFSQSLAEVNEIYLELRDRIYDFFNLEVLIHSYNKYFEKQNIPVCLVDSNSGKGIEQTIRHIEKMMQAEQERLAEKGRIGRTDGRTS